MKFPSPKAVVKQIVGTFFPNVELSETVFNMAADVVHSILKEEPEKAAIYARRAALRQAFDSAQKLKRGEKL